MFHKVIVQYNLWVLKYSQFGMPIYNVDQLIVTAIRKLILPKHEVYVLITPFCLHVLEICLYLENGILKNIRFIALIKGS